MQKTWLAYVKRQCIFCDGRFIETNQTFNIIIKRINLLLILKIKQKKRVVLFAKID